MMKKYLVVTMLSVLAPQMIRGDNVSNAVSEAMQNPNVKEAIKTAEDTIDTLIPNNKDGLKTLASYFYYKIKHFAAADAAYAARAYTDAAYAAIAAATAYDAAAYAAAYVADTPARTADRAAARAAATAYDTAVYATIAAAVDTPTRTAVYAKLYIHLVDQCMNEKPSIDLGVIPDKWGLDAGLSYQCIYNELKAGHSLYNNDVLKKLECHPAQVKQSAPTTQTGK